MDKETIGFHRPLAGHEMLLMRANQAAALCLLGCTFFPCFLQLSITKYQILHLTRYLVDIGTFCSQAKYFAMTLVIAMKYISSTCCSVKHCSGMLRWAWKSHLASSPISLHLSTQNFHGLCTGHKVSQGHQLSVVSQLSSWMLHLWIWVNEVLSEKVTVPNWGNAHMHFIFTD